MLPSSPSVTVPLSRDRVALLLLAASLVLRLAAAASVGPGFDEAYYHLFSLHLAAGYFDHPPLVAFTAGLGRWLTGVQSPLTLRLGAVLWFTVALVGFDDLARRLYGARAARLVLLLASASPYFAFGAGAFVLPDNALIALWVWALAVASRLRDGSLPRTLGFLLLGALTGLGMLAKYHMVLLPAALAIAALTDPVLRRWWRDWRLYLALLVALAVFSPCLFWNAANGWVSFTEQFGKGASGSLSFRPDLVGSAIGGQLAYLTPWLAVALWIGALRRGREDRADRWLLAPFLLPVLAFTLIGMTRTILPHWTMPGYVAAVVLAGGAFAGKPRSMPWAAAAAAANIALVALVVLQAHTGFLPLRERSDPTLDPAGWEQTLRWAEEEGALGEGEVLFAHKWFTAAQLAWADRGRHPVVLLGDKPHMFAWWSPPAEYAGRSGVLITQARYALSEADRERWLDSRFRRVTRLDPPGVPRGGQVVGMAAWRLDTLAVPPTMPYGPFSGAVKRWGEPPGRSGMRPPAPAAGSHPTGW